MSVSSWRGTTYLEINMNTAQKCIGGKDKNEDFQLNKASLFQVLYKANLNNDIGIFRRTYCYLLTIHF